VSIETDATTAHTAPEAERLLGRGVDAVVVVDLWKGREQRFR